MSNTKQKQEELQLIEDQIDQAAKEITELLKRKNRAYGNSLASQNFTFANEINKTNLTTPQYSMCCRIDDKLARIRNAGITKETLDTVDDLIGYLLRLKISLNDNFKRHDN